MTNTPKQRMTRSVTNSGNITLHDIKVLIEKTNGELLNSLTKNFEQELEKLNQTITSLHSRVEKLEETNAKLALRCELLEKKNIQAVPNDTTAFEDACHESEERWRRRDFLIVSGMSEHSSGSVEERNAKDRAFAVEMARELGMADFNPEQVARIGRVAGARPRLLRIKCQNINVKLSLLRQSKKLRDSTRFRNVYINPDLTNQQRAKSAELRSELKRRRENGEKVIIRGGRIVDVSSGQNFH